MAESNQLTERDFTELSSEILELIENSWDRALKDPFPESKELLSRVYKNE